jgi:hypothetical protein
MKFLIALFTLAPGGGYDIYARALARHLGRHIPGNPIVVVQNMPRPLPASSGHFCCSSSPSTPVSGNLASIAA